MPEATKALLLALFNRAVAAAGAGRRLPGHLPRPPTGRTLVLGAGTAAADMARVVSEAWPREAPLSGLVAVPGGHGVAAGRIEVVESGHPLPAEASAGAARSMLEAASALGPEDLALCLFSGGGSAALALPAPGLTMADKQDVTAALLAAGAAIADINCVRKHLSAIKGGRLAAACAPAPVCNLLISDVPGDDPATIASGPALGDSTTFAQARDVLGRHGIEPPKAVAEVLAAGQAETPKPGDPVLAAVEATVIADGATALAAAAETAREWGLAAEVMGHGLEGEARAVAGEHAALVRERAGQGAGRGVDMVLLSGGELTVRVDGGGGAARGGPNQEYLLALMIALRDMPGVYALACDSDGIDGSSSHAGAWFAPGDLARAREAGLDGPDYLERHDSHGFFAALGTAVVTGPTLTNVNDFRVIVLKANELGY